MNVIVTLNNLICNDTVILDRAKISKRVVFNLYLSFSRKALKEYLKTKTKVLFDW